MDGGVLPSLVPVNGPQNLNYLFKQINLLKIIENYPEVRVKICVIPFLYQTSNNKIKTINKEIFIF